VVLPNLLRANGADAEVFLGEALRSRTEGSQDESRCGAIHKPRLSRFVAGHLASTKAAASRCTPYEFRTSIIPHNDISARHTSVRRTWLRVGCVFLLVGCGDLLVRTADSLPAAPQTGIRIPRGRAIAVDGVKSAGEWDHASMTQFSVAPGWNVRVFAKHDAQNLYFDFEGVTHAGSRLFPEILLDPRHAKSPAWQKGQWWLHVSNNLCEANDAADVYEKNGKFQCSRRKPGWDGNNPPEDHTELIEVKISFAKLGLDYAPGMKIGLAFDLTDANGKAEQKGYFWPAGAKIDSPKTWGVAVVE
jgi:hypothetical protein